MKKNGFIATSLIYSFFLVFIAIIAALLSSYIANKTILDRFNGEVQNSLNTDTYTVILKSRTANITNGMTLTNLVSNGDFSNGVNFWTPVGSSSFSTTMWLNNYSLFKSNNNTSNSYVYQNVYLLENSQYYFSIDYSHNASATLNTYLSDPRSGIIQTQNNLSRTWDRGSQKYNSTYDGNVRFIVGDSGSVSYSGNTYFTHAMVINLTASFGKGNEPDGQWIDDNIDWFDGTINYIRLSDIESGENIKIRFSPHQNYRRSRINCTSDTGQPTPPVTINWETIDERTYANLEFAGINSNLRCDVEWSA